MYFQSCDISLLWSEDEGYTTIIWKKGNDIDLRMSEEKEISYLRAVCDQVDKSWQDSFRGVIKLIL